jgi:hypothetical protein
MEGIVLEHVGGKMFPGVPDTFPKISEHLVEIGVPTHYVIVWEHVSTM